jgi:membrane protein
MDKPAPNANHPSRARRLARRYKRIARDTFQTIVAVAGFLGERQASLLAAGLAFFALISLAPFIILAVAIGGAIFGPEATRDELRLQIGDEMGPQVTDFILSFAEGAANLASLSVASFVGLLLLFWSSMRLFVEVRSALHAIWNLPPPSIRTFKSTIARFFRGRLIAAAGTLLFGAIFLVLLASRLLLNNLLGIAPGKTPLSIPWWLWSTVEYLLALVTLTLVVHAVYRLLPDRGPRGKALLVGSLITAYLLMVGRSIVGWYVSAGAIGSAYGAAGALIVFLIWAYWSALAFLFGARLTFALREKWSGDNPSGPE